MAKQQRTPEQKKRYAEKERGRRAALKAAGVKSTRKQILTEEQKARAAKLAHERWHQQIASETPEDRNTRIEKQREQNTKWRLENPEKRAKSKNKSYQKNSVTIKEKVKKYATENAEKVKEVKKIYRESNAAVIKAKQRQFYKKNRTALLTEKKKYYSKNKPLLMEKKRVYMNKRLSSDPIFKVIHNTRTLIRNSFKRACDGLPGKPAKTEIILGCSMNVFLNYVEGLLQPGMTIENYGPIWHLDHIIPISSTTSGKEAVKLNHFTNFQPLWAEENAALSNKFKASNVRTKKLTGHGQS